VSHYKGLAVASLFRENALGQRATGALARTKRAARTWPEQIELFVFQLFSELSKTFEQIELFAFQLFSELSKTFASAALSAVSTCSSTAPGGAPAASGMA
jgi:hypothetical protein